MKHLALPLALCLSLSGPALADGLDRSLVPAQAQAVVHMDFEALAASQLARMMAELDGEFDLDMDLGEEFPMFAGFRPLRDIRSVTVFALDVKKEQAGALVHTTSAANPLLEAARDVEQYAAADIGGHALHSWSMDGEMVYAAVFQNAGSDDQMVLVSNSEAVMTAGLAVVAGGADSLAGADVDAMTATPPLPGAILYAATDRSLGELGDIDATSAVAEMVQGMVLQVGESRGEVFASVALRASDMQETQRVRQVLQGITALAGLMGAEEEQGQALQNLAGALRYRSTGNHLFIDFSYNLQALVEDLETLAEGH